MKTTLKGLVLTIDCNIEGLTENMKGRNVGGLNTSDLNGFKAGGEIKIEEVEVEYEPQEIPDIVKACGGMVKEILKQRKNNKKKGKRCEISNRTVTVEQSDSENKEEEKDIKE